MEHQFVTISVPRVDWVYPIASCGGAALGYFVRRKRSGYSPIPQEIRWDCAVLIGLAAVIGAYAIGPISYWWGTGYVEGRSVISALLFGWIVTEVIKAILGIRRSIGDPIALPLALAFGGGRIGCIFAHCCDGGSQPGAIAFTHDGREYFPTGLYEVAFHLGWAGVLFWCSKRGLYRGQQLRVYLGSYCIYRFVTEYWRGYPVNHYGFTVYQILCGVFLMVIGATVSIERGRTR